MDEYIFGQRNNIHIIDLEKTVPMLYNALEVLHNIAKKGGSILFVGTKRSASEIISSSAINCGQFYVHHRWLGGMLTNWETVSKSIKRLKDLEKKMESGEINSLTKKERLTLERSREKLELNLGGIKNMSGTPDALFIIDINKEAIAVEEAKKLNIPIVAVCDTNTDPKKIDYPIPGNDDAVRSISLYCDLVGATILSGMEENLTETGVDLGNAENVVEEKIPDDQQLKETSDDLQTNNKNDIAEPESSDSSSKNSDDELLNEENDK